MKLINNQNPILTVFGAKAEYIEIPKNFIWTKNTIHQHYLFLLYVTSAANVADIEKIKNLLNIESDLFPFNKTRKITKQQIRKVYKDLSALRMRELLLNTKGVCAKIDDGIDTVLSMKQEYFLYWFEN